MKYFPLNDYVVIKKLPAKTTTASGIIISTRDESDRAQVVSVSEDAQPVSAVLKNNTLKFGDVLIIRWSNALHISGDQYAISYKEIVCKVEE
jgi:co-chaperonin GroES (HSP10)